MECKATMLLAMLYARTSGNCGLNLAGDNRIHRPTMGSPQTFKNKQKSSCALQNNGTKSLLMNILQFHLLTTLNFTKAC